MAKWYYSDENTVQRFRELQTQLRQRFQTLSDQDLKDQDVVVIPSLSLDNHQLEKIQGSHQYEERLLFSLIRLRNPRMRLIYVSSQPVHPTVIDYYLYLMPGIPLSHVRDRLLLFSTYDTSPKPLTQKILERPRLISRIHQVLRPNKSYMVCFNSTPLERELSVQLDIPLFGVDPDLNYWGTKSGSRQIFAEVGIPHPDGSSLVWNVDDLTEAALELWDRQPSLKRMVIKLNQGFSGEGNALLDLRPFQDLTHHEREKTLKKSWCNLRFQAPHETWETFSDRISELGAIVEAFIEGEVKESPSVQCEIFPTGKVIVLSTHDQILSGPDGQVFLGCRFPAQEPYRLQLQEMGEKIGQNLAEKGALERFSVDFIAVNQPNSYHWDLQAIEINLRRGGTTHPFMTLKLLTNGRYDLQTGLFYNQQSRPKFYIASDNLQSERYQGLLPNDLMDIIVNHELHFDNSTETGTVFHLMGCLSRYGKLGLTCIGNSPEHAQEIYDRVVAVLDEETQIQPFRSWENHSLLEAIPIIQ
jgi:hypothetical protein